MLAVRSALSAECAESKDAVIGAGGAGVLPGDARYALMNAVVISSSLSSAPCLATGLESLQGISCLLWQLAVLLLTVLPLAVPLMPCSVLPRPSPRKYGTVEVDDKALGESGAGDADVEREAATTAVVIGVVEGAQFSVKP